MRFLALIGALAIIAAIGAAIYFFGGFYNVAETADNPAIVDWALASVQRSFGRRAWNRDAASQSRRSRDG